MPYFNVSWRIYVEKDYPLTQPTPLNTIRRGKKGLPMLEAGPPTCAYCYKIIVRSEPERKGDLNFCNSLCVVGYEADQRIPVPYESAR